MYVFDTSSFIVLSHYFPDRFPSFWENLAAYIEDKRIVSVREVRHELDPRLTRPHMEEWLRNNRHIFLTPTEKEMAFVADIFAVPEFQSLVRKKQILSGSPVADPFVIAAARAKDACVVTEERQRERAIRIPDVCTHFGIDCTNMEGFMKREDWQY